MAEIIKFKKQVIGSVNDNFDFKFYIDCNLCMSKKDADDSVENYRKTNKAKFSILVDGKKVDSRKLIKRLEETIEINVQYRAQQLIDNKISDLNCKLGDFSEAQDKILKEYKKMCYEKLGFKYNEEDEW